MKSLVRVALLHLLRARTVWVVFIFALTMQFLGLSAITKVNMQFNGAVMSLGSKEVFFGALLIQLFSGFFTGAIYGIWMVPQLHRGTGGQLTHMIPVSKWKFPLAYTISFSLLLVLQMLVGVAVSVLLVNEFASTINFKWLERLVACLLGELAALNVLMLGFSVFSLYFKPVPTFFLGLVFTVCSQMFAVGERLAEQWMGAYAGSGFLYYLRGLFRYLPPLGQFVFELSDIYRNLNIQVFHFGLWVIWFFIFLGIFQQKIRFPDFSGNSEAS